jgi:hypothetical protein
MLRRKRGIVPRRLSVWWPSILVVAKREMSSIAAHPTRSPIRQNRTSRCASELMPARRAASDLRQGQPRVIDIRFCVGFSLPWVGSGRPVRFLSASSNKRSGLNWQPVMATTRNRNVR